MKSIRLLAVLAVLLGAALVPFACGGGDDDGAAPGEATTGEAAENFKWVMVTDQAGLGDQGFNDLAYAGVTQAADELGGTRQAIESREQAQYVPNLQQAVASGATLTIGVGFLITDAIHEVAMANPEGKFVLIDAVSADNAGTPDDFTDDVPDENVQSVLFKEHEGAYLGGIIAGMTTKQNRIGFVGGIEAPVVVRFLAGFRAALESVNPKARVDVAYVGSFGDPAKAKEITNALLEAGADVIFEVGGASGLGSYEAVKARGEGVWIMGTDTCKQRLAPDNWLTSATKDVSGAVFRAAEQVKDGTFKGGIVNLGLAEDAVGVCEETFGDLSQEIQDAVEKAEAQIKSGEIVVPATLEELEKFTPPSN
jgi:basic membrane protein A